MSNGMQLPDIDFIDPVVSSSLSYASGGMNAFDTYSPTTGSVPRTQPQIQTIPSMQQRHAVNDAMKKQQMVQQWAQQQLLAQQQRIQMQQSLPQTAPMQYSTPMNVSAPPNMFVPTTMDFSSISTFDPNNMLDDIPDIPVINDFVPPESSSCGLNTSQAATIMTPVIKTEPNVPPKVKEIEKTAPVVVKEEIQVEVNRNSSGSEKEEEKNESKVLDSDMSETWKGFEYMESSELKDILNSVSTFSKGVGDLRKELDSKVDWSLQGVKIKRQDKTQKAESVVAPVPQRKQSTPPPQPRVPVVAPPPLQTPMKPPVANPKVPFVGSTMIPIWACYSCRQDGLPVAAYLHTNCAKCLQQRAALEANGNLSTPLMQQSQMHDNYDTDSSSSRKKKRWVPRVANGWRCSVCHRSDVTPAARKHCTGCYRRQLRERKAAAAANPTF